MSAGSPVGDAEIFVRKYRPAKGSAKSRWRAIYRLTFEDGTKAEKTLVLKSGDRQAAMREAVENKHKIVKAIVAAQNPAGAAMNRYALDFVERNFTAGRYEMRTYNSYKKFAREAGEFFGSTPIWDVQPDDVQRYLGWLSDKGLAPVTVKNAFRFLRTMYRDAFRKREIDFDPTSVVDPPKAPPVKAGVNYLEAKERKRLLGLLDEYGDCALTAGARIILLTGMRRSEACALHWGDVDFDASVITVQRAASGTMGRRHGVKAPKNDKKRNVALSPSLAEALHRWKAKCEEEFGPLDPDDVLLDPSRPRGSTFSPDAFSNLWRPFARAHRLIGVEGRYETLHDLRHTWATMYLAAGGDIMTAKQNLGHSRASMTLDVYAAADRSAAARAASIIDGAVMGGRIEKTEDFPAGGGMTAGDAAAKADMERLEDMCKKLMQQNAELMRALERESHSKAQRRETPAEELSRALGLDGKTTLRYLGECS